MKDLTELKEIKLSEKLNNTKSEGLSSTDKEKLNQELILMT